jgi:hypothetical protein
MGKKAKKKKSGSKSGTFGAVARDLGEEVSHRLIEEIAEVLVKAVRKELKRAGASIARGLSKLTTHEEHALLLPAPSTPTEETRPAKPGKKRKKRARR